jgi:DNA-binding MarR family transcriptional regulator
MRDTTHDGPGAQAARQITLSLTPEQAEALETMASYGIDEKGYVLSRPEWEHGYDQSEVTEQQATLEAAWAAVQRLQEAQS